MPMQGTLLSPSTIAYLSSRCPMSISRSEEANQLYTKSPKKAIW